MIFVYHTGVIGWSYSWKQLTIPKSCPAALRAEGNEYRGTSVTLLRSTPVAHQLGLYFRAQDWEGLQRDLWRGVSEYCALVFLSASTCEETGKARKQQSKQWKGEYESQLTGSLTKLQHATSPKMKKSKLKKGSQLLLYLLFFSWHSVIYQWLHGIYCKLFLLVFP